MNPTPFSLEHKFTPDTASEDKIDLELRGWRIFDLNNDHDSLLNFKRSMASPAAGQEDLAWPNGDQPPFYGKFFRRPESIGGNRNKLLIRKQCISDTIHGRYHQPPLCGGYGLLFREKSADPITKKCAHRLKLVLALNLQRFIRHQPSNDTCNPFPKKPRLQRRTGDRSFSGEECAFDNEDNWIPTSETWSKFSTGNRLGDYIQQIVKEVDSDLKRACEMQTALGNAATESWDEVCFSVEEAKFSIKQVETLWEFPSSSPMLDVFEIGKMLLHLKKQGGEAKLHSFGNKEAKRILNSPCFVIPVAEGVKLRLYAKTNKRIRFELIQSNLLRKRGELVKEAGLNPEPLSQGWEAIPPVVLAIRKRASEYMNQIMEELRKGREQQTVPYSPLHLLAEISASITPGLSLQSRFERMQTLMVWICFQRGYRGSIKNGPYKDSLKRLVERGVLVFDRKRQYYTLNLCYVSAVDALTKVTGEPLLQLFGTGWGGYSISSDGKRVVRLRE